MCILTTDRPANSRDDLVRWVGDFIDLYDKDGYEPGGMGMSADEAAEIIVNQILEMLHPLLIDRVKKQGELPNPEIFFHN